MAFMGHMEHIGHGHFGRTSSLLSLQSLLSFFTPLWEANESNKNKAVQHADGFVFTALFRIRALD